MSALSDQLLTVATTLVASLPAGEDLDAALRAGHEGERLAQLKLVGELHRLTDALGARLAGDLDRRDETDLEPIATRHGERTLADVVARASGLPYWTAQSWCTVGIAVTTRNTLLGEALPAAHPRIGAALDLGEVTIDAAASIARALHQLEAHASLDERDAAEAFLVQEAQVLTLRQLGRLCGELQDRFDPDGIEPREDLLRRRASIRMVRRRDGGSRWILDLDPESEGMLKAAMTR